MPGALEREHAELLRLGHPRLRSLRGAERGPEPFVVLEYIDGRTPLELVQAQPEAVNTVAIGVLRALCHLHAHERVHGDLKPQNIVVDTDGPCLVDLGFCVPIGHRVAGGTGGFLAPELLRGGPASVAADLYAFARTIESLGGAPSSELAALVAQAASPEPAARPASASAALARLGEVPYAEDRGALAWVGGAEARLREAVQLGPGQTYAVEAGPSAGKTRLCRELERHGARHWVPTAVLAASALPDAFEGPGTLVDRCLRAGRQLGETTLVVDLDDTSEDTRRALVALSRSVAVHHEGRLIVVGVDGALGETLRTHGARVARLPPLAEPDVKRLLQRSGARAPSGLVTALTEVGEGAAARIARAARRLAHAPEMTDEQVLDVARVATPPPVALPPAAALELAGRALDNGTPHRAVEVLQHAFATPEHHREAGPLLAHACFAAGRLEEARGLFERFDRPEHALVRARLSAKLGRHEEVLSLTRDASSPEADVLFAASALALGRMEALAHRIDAAFRRDPPASVRASLLRVRSDAALRNGDVDAALRDAELALALAGDDLTAAARAEGRIGSAHALHGHPRLARVHQARALRAIEAAGDVAALPSYVINLAAAEHASGELGAALQRYEEGARLARRLGRVGMLAAAEVNRAGLLVLVGAHEEAAAVLAGARRAAEQAGAQIYLAQARLIEAERLASQDRTSALVEARAAREAFEACGATRQALEATLLVHELRADRAADVFVASNLDALADAGLRARGLLLRAEVALTDDRRADAMALAEEALEDARDGTDAELEARAWALGAKLHRLAGSVDAERRQEMAAATLARIGQSLPAGLRERFVASRADWTQSAPASVARSSALGDGGRRLLLLMRRVLLDGDEGRVLEAAVDEAIALTRAERAFLLQKNDTVRIARNLDRATIQGQFSRSVAERVLASGEPVLTQMATRDPALAGARSIADLGLRSILCVPIRSREQVVGALYLDHRFETARFGDDDLELVSALSDIIGLALENARLHREAAARARALERSNREVRDAHHRATERLAELEQRLANTVDGHETAGVVGSSRAIRHALAVARRVAPSDLSVLIEGESGTGKELFARYVHSESRRAGGPFLALNCGALPETLLESELFGHVRGAFTGATRDHPGLFRSGRGGTLLLDEIGEMPLRMQVRLLRVLQEREVRPVGATRRESIDVRIVAATHRRLEEEVEAGRFRSDLYFRLVGVRIALPPLRERRDDIPALVERLLERIGEEPGMRPVTLSREAMGALLLHDWPGNVRELEQALRRGILIADSDVLGPADLSLAFARVVDRASALRTFDRGLVERALQAADGNKSKAARALGVSRPTLYRWLKRYRL